MKKGWEVKELGEVCDIIGGGTPSKSNEGFYTGHIPWVTVRDMKGDTIYNTEFSITEEAVKKSSTNVIPKDNVVIATRVGLGKVCLLAKDSAINQDLKGVIPKKGNDISRRFLFWWFYSVAHTIVQAGTGATVQGVKLPFIKSLPFPSISLSEQQRVVSILDEAFAAIDQAKENVQRNLQNAKELFQSELNSIFANKGEGWEEKKLGSTCIVERGSSPRPIERFVTDNEDGVNWIKIGDTKGVTKYIYTTKEKITPEGAKKSRYVKEGDFILSNSMSFGNPFIMKTNGYIHDGWFVLRLPENLNSDYLYYLLISPNVQDQIHLLASGAIVKNISGDLIRQVKLVIPPVDEQQEIVVKLDGILTEIKQIESLYQKKLDTLDELKKSILQKAFSGELTEARELEFNFEESI